MRDEGSAIVVGATTRQCVLEHDATVRAKVPLLAKVMPFVGHAPIRARGTVGGSLANADPAAEIALAAVTLAATLVYREGDTVAECAAADFFIGPMMTALPAAGCLTAVRFPVWREARIGVGFHEVNARRSDFAFASAAAQIALDDAGLCRRVALGVGGITPVPLRLDAVGRRARRQPGGGSDHPRRRARGARRYRAVVGSACIGRLSPARRGDACRARDHRCLSSRRGRACRLN